MLATKQRPYNIWSRNIFPFSMENCVLYAPLWQEDMQAATLLSYDQYHHSCTVTGATWGSQGRAFGGADLININAVLAKMASNTTGTLICWNKVTNATSGAYEITLGFGDTDAGSLVGFGKSNTDKLHCNLYVGGSNKWLVATTANPYSNDTWLMTSVVQNGTSPVLYVNDTQPAQSFSVQLDKTVWFSSIPLLDNARIGCINYNNLGNTFYVTGSVGDVLIYSRALSASEVYNIYEVTKWRYM